MKNFLRALRHAWPYRRRLILSVCCAGWAAVLWGLNFTSIYPVLKLLHTEQSPHQWVDERIAGTGRDVEDLEGQIDRLNERQKELERKAPSRDVEKEKRDIARELARLEARLGPGRTALFYYRVLRKYIYEWLPPDCFQC